MTEITTTEELLALRGKDGVIRIEEDLTITCDVPWSVGKDIADLYVRGYLDVRGNLDVGGYHFVITGDLIWSHAHTPKLPENTYIKRVLPPEFQREHWQERLGMDISEGCYDSLCAKVLKQIVNLLRDDKWTSTERWMLETLRDSEKPLPGWVEEFREAQQKPESERAA